jgi:hypothetical protein
MVSLLSTWKDEKWVVTSSKRACFQKDHEKSQLKFADENDQRCTIVPADKKWWMLDVARLFASIVLWNFAMARRMRAFLRGRKRCISIRNGYGEKSSEEVRIAWDSRKRDNSMSFPRHRPRCRLDADRRSTMKQIQNCSFSLQSKEQKTMVMLLLLLH